MWLSYSLATDTERNLIEQIKASFVGRSLMQDDHGTLPGGGSWDAWRRGSQVEVLFKNSSADKRRFIVSLS